MLRYWLLGWVVLSQCANAVSGAASGMVFEEVAQGVFVHHGVHQDIDDGYSGDICNISFVIGREGVAVIDTGGSPEVGRQLLAAIRMHTDKPIKYVINTHIHPDHVFGNVAFVNEKPQFVGHAQLAHAMKQRETHYLALQQRVLGKQAEGSALIPPDVALTQAIELSLGDKTLKLTPYPTAHTHTDVTVEETQTQTLWTGDLLFVERTPSIDGDIQGWYQAIARLSSTKVAHVVPGHGPTQTRLDLPLAEQKYYFDVLMRDVRAAIKSGVSMREAMNTAAQSERKKWVLFDVVNRRNINLLYPMLEWE